MAPSHNPIVHNTKHTELDIFVFREKVVNKSLIIQQVPVVGEKNVDLLTNPLSPHRFLLLRDKLKVVDMEALSQLRWTRGRR